MSRPYNSNERENRTMQKNITLIYGDCSSPEIVTQAVRVLDKIAARHGHTFTYTRAYMGGEAIDRFGDPLPASELEKCKSSDSVLLGAIGGPKWEGLPGDQRPLRQLLETDCAPDGFDGTWVAAVAHRHLHRGAGGQLVGQRDVQLAVDGAELGRPPAVDLDLGHRQRIRQIQGEPVQ